MNIKNWTINICLTSSEKKFSDFDQKKRENFRMAFNRKMPTLYKNFIKPLLSHFCFFQRCPVELSTAEERSHFITKVLWSFAKSVEVRVSKLQTHFSQNLLVIVDKLFSQVIPVWVNICILLSIQIFFIQILSNPLLWKAPAETLLIMMKFCFCFKIWSKHVKFVL